MGMIKPCASVSTRQRIDHGLDSWQQMVMADGAPSLFMRHSIRRNRYVAKDYDVDHCRLLAGPSTHKLYCRIPKD